MTNNVSLFDIQNKLCNKYYEKIYDNMKQKYDYTIIDLPASPFLDVVPYTLINANIIYFVINPNYISIRQAIKYLELMCNIWDISKDKINIIVNRFQKDSLDKIQIKSLLKGYNVILNIPYVNNIDSYINGNISNIFIDLNYKDVYKSLNMEKYYSYEKSNKQNVAKIISGVFKRNL